MVSVDKTISKDHINNLIKVALDEDIGSGDITTRSIVSPDDIYIAEVINRENIILCGLNIFMQSCLLPHIFHPLNRYRIFRQDIVFVLPILKHQREIRGKIAIHSVLH